MGVNLVVAPNMQIDFKAFYEDDVLDEESVLLNKMEMAIMN